MFPSGTLTALRAIVSLVALASAAFDFVHPQSNEQRTSVRIVQPRFTGGVSPMPSLLPFREVERPTVALVLSGGGARAIAGIGVLKVLERAEVPIDLIVGTSMGSIVGGLYAAGYSTDQLKRLVDTTRWEEVLSLTDDARRRDQFLDQKLTEDRSILTIRFRGLEPIIPQAFTAGQRLTHYLNILTLQGIYHAGESFEQLRVPFLAITTDLISGQRVVLDRGDLTHALRASVSVPLLFSPVHKDTTRLLDGGLVSNIPVDVAKSWGADIVIAVDVTSPLRPAEQLNAPWEIADQIMGIMMQAANKEQLAQADVVIRPAIGEQLSSNFSNFGFLVGRGEEAAEAAMPHLQELLRTKSAERYRALSGGREYVNARLQFDAVALDQQWILRLIPLARKPVLPEEELLALVTEMYGSGDFESVRVDVAGEGTPSLNLLAIANPVLREVVIEGTRSLDLDTLRSVFTPLVGRRLNHHWIRRAFEAIIGIYRSRGYSLARIREASFDRATGVARVQIDEGIVFRRDIRGTAKTKDYVIWRELPWRQGDVFDIARVAAGVSNLYGTNLFEQVSISAHTEGENDEHNVIVINVRERHTELIRLGLRTDNERNIQPMVSVRDENLFGIGAELGVMVAGGARNRSVAGEFKATRIFNSYLTFSLKAHSSFRDVHVYADEPLSDPARWDRVRVGEYRELRRGGIVSFGTQLERLGTVTVDGRLEHHRVWSISGTPVGTESFRIGSIRFGLKIDNLDRFPFAREGLKLNFFYESAIVPLRGSVGFTKMTLQYDAFKTYYGRHTLRPRIQFGFADETLPISEQFSIGGQEGFFGLREDNARGRQLLVTSLEYRYESPIRIFFDTYLKVRYDLGSIWAVPDQIRLKDLRHGIGLGIAFDTPIGPAELSVGRSFYFRKDLLNNPVSVGPVLGYFSIGYSL